MGPRDRLLTGLPQVYRNSYAATEAMSLSPNADGIPTFKILDKEPLRPGSILVGGTLSLAVIAAFGFVLSRPIAYLPVSGSNGRMSPIESVMERLNRATMSDTTAGGAQEAAKPASAEARDQQLRHSPAAPASAPKANTSAPIPASGSFVGDPNRVVPIQMQNPNDHSIDEARAARAFKTPPETSNPRSVGTNGNVPANGLTADESSSTGNSKPVNEHALSLIVAGQPQLENASSAMIRLLQTHDIVMFGEVHDSEQEYEWLCKLVKTPGFAGHVDDIVVEFGNALYQKTVDRYVAGGEVPFDEVQKAWRNMVADTEPVSPVYGWLYKAVREVNMEHPGKRGIRLLMGSPPAIGARSRTPPTWLPMKPNGSNGTQM